MGEEKDYHPAWKKTLDTGEEHSYEWLKSMRVTEVEKLGKETRCGRNNAFCETLTCEQRDGAAGRALNHSSLGPTCSSRA